ncbi:MAG: DUF1565 domain-containing protein, partial [Verrucomicrobia bacterium]|nr:DUF1565 domain-containing protein [Verrucomicrobiota bacterium]
MVSLIEIMKYMKSPPRCSHYTTVLIALACVCLGSATTRAALLAHEPFTNAPGSAIIGSGDGAGFAGVWQANGSSGVGTNTAAGLSYTDTAGNTLVTEGGAGFFQGDTLANNSMQPTRLFDFIRGADGTTTWISFLAVRQGPATAGANPYPRGANVPHDLNAGNLQKLAIGNSSGAAANTVGLIPLGSASNLKPSQVTFSQLNFIVVRVDHVAGANDNAYLFLNPQLGTQPSLIQADTNSLGEFDFTFDRLRVFAGGNDAGNSRPYAELVIDEYRLGETYADVTPYIPAAPPGPLVITNVSLVGNSILLAGSGGTPTWNYEVLSSADLQVPSSNWPVAGSNSFDPAGNFAWTNPVDLNAGEAYYRLFVPNQTSPPPVLPGIVSPPTNLTVAVGQPAAFSVIANGTEPLGYQWFFNTNSPLPAATNTSYSIASAQLTNAGTYSVRVANDFGAITSSFALLTVTAAPPVFSANYYVATYGSDSNPGTNINAPFATLSKAVSVASAGKLIYVRGGTYNWSSRVTMSISGTPTQPIRVFAYPGESPVFNFASQPTGDSNQGISISGNCWHLKGLEVANAGDNGIIVTGKTNTIELCVLRGNRDSGLQLHNAGAAYNYVLNCDSYRNYDPANQGENADGFAAKFTLGPGNLF